MRISLHLAMVGLALSIPTAARCVLISDFDGGGVTAGQIFQDPSFSGSTDFNLAPGDSTTISTEKAFSGASSLKVSLAFVSNDPAIWDRLTTSGSNPVIYGTGVTTMKVFNAGQDPIGIALGIREVDYGSDPAIGSSGSGASKGIEFVGSNGNTGAAPNPVHVIQPGSWQDLTFNMASDPLGTLTGNSILEPKFGKVNLEDLAIRSPGTTNPIVLYIDDVQTLATEPVIPEPGTLALLAIGGLPLLALRRRSA